MNRTRVVITQDQLNQVKKAMRICIDKYGLSHPYMSEIACLRQHVFNKALEEVLPQYIIGTLPSGHLSHKKNFSNKSVWYLITGDNYDITILMYVNTSGGKIKYQLKLGCLGDLVETGEWFGQATFALRHSANCLDPK